MKYNQVIPVVTLGLVAATALVLSFRSQVGVDSIVGYASVLALLGLAALEYRINWKWLLRR